MQRGEGAKMQNSCLQTGLTNNFPPDILLTNNARACDARDFSQH
jgi:hypothetical protein